MIINYIKLFKKLSRKPPVILGLGRYRQSDQEFKVILSY